MIQLGVRIPVWNLSGQIPEYFSRSFYNLQSPRRPTEPIVCRMAKVVTLEELKKHTTKDSLYVLLHEKGEPSSPENEQTNFGFLLTANE